MQNLLQKSRRLNKMLQRASGQPISFGEVAEALKEITGSDVVVLSRKGKVLGASDGADIGTELSHSVNELLLDIDASTVNPDSEVKDLFKGLNVAVFPANGGTQRLGTLVMARGSQFNDDDLVLAEFCATVLGMEITRSKASVVEEEARQRAIVKMALDTLSYSEQEAVEHIFKELNGREGLLVASKIADRVGITRSVIVNALRKFESAGVIESRSLGMKGTFIRILNDQLLPELEKLINR